MPFDEEDDSEKGQLLAPHQGMAVQDEDRGKGKVQEVQHNIPVTGLLGTGDKLLACPKHHQTQGLQPLVVAQKGRSPQIDSARSRLQGDGVNQLVEEQGGREGLRTKPANASGLH